MDKRGRASRLYRVDLHFLAGVLLLLFLLVLGQEEVQEEGHDEADGVRRFQEDDRRRPVGILALSYSRQHAPLLFVHVRTSAPVSESTGNVLHVL